MQLCTVHGNNLVPEVCNACRACSHFVKSSVVKQLAVSHSDTAASGIPGPAERLLGRCSDERDPTLNFSSEKMAIASSMFTMGTFKKGHFEELTK